MYPSRQQNHINQPPMQQQIGQQSMQQQGQFRSISTSNITQNQQNNNYNMMHMNTVQYYNYNSLQQQYNQLQQNNPINPYQLQNQYVYYNQNIQATNTNPYNPTNTFYAQDMAPHLHHTSTEIQNQLNRWSKYNPVNRWSNYNNFVQNKSRKHIKNNYNYNKTTHYRNQNTGNWNWNESYLYSVETICYSDTDSSTNLNTNLKSQSYQPYHAHLKNTFHAPRELLMSGYIRIYLNKSKWIIPNVIIDLFVLFYDTYSNDNKLVLVTDSLQFGFYTLNYGTKQLIYYKPDSRAKLNNFPCCVAQDIRCNVKHNTINKLCCAKSDQINALFFFNKCRSVLQFKCILFGESKAIQVSLPAPNVYSRSDNIKSAYSCNRNELVVLLHSYILIFNLIEWKWIKRFYISWPAPYGFCMILMDYHDMNKLFIASINKKFGCFTYDLTTTKMHKLKWPTYGLGRNPAICFNEIDKIYVYGGKVTRNKTHIRTYNLTSNQWDEEYIKIPKPRIHVKKPIMWIEKDNNLLFFASCSKDLVVKMCAIGDKHWTTILNFNVYIKNNNFSIFKL